MPSARQLTLRVLETSGLVRQSNLRVLRDHLKTQTEEQISKEIKEMETPRQLRVMWEAGLSAPLQKAVTDRLDEIS